MRERLQPGTTDNTMSAQQDGSGTEMKVFHAGTARRDGKIVTSGGRVLGVTALGENLAAARGRAYAALESIQFEGMHYRSDIGAQALNAR